MYEKGGRINKETKGTVAKGELVHGFVILDSRLNNGKSAWIAEQIKKNGGK